MVAVIKAKKEQAKNKNRLFFIILPRDLNIRPILLLDFRTFREKIVVDVITREKKILLI
jgi:hypothetical protein